MLLCVQCSRCQKPSNAVVGRVDAAVVILHVVFRMVGIVDTCQTVVVVGIGYHLTFFRHVSRLLGEYVAERVVGERCLSTCRMVHLRAAVAHVQILFFTPKFFSHFIRCLQL